MKKKTPAFRIWMFLVLFLAAFQAAPAENFLYLFKKSGSDALVAVEAVKEEKISGFLKLTTADGKVAAWQETMLLAKFGLFNEADGIPEQTSVDTYVSELESFMAREPASSVYLKPLVEKWKVHTVEAKAVVEDNTRKESEEKLAKFLAERYRAEQNYPLELLETKAVQAQELTALLPERGDEISTYLGPWAEELKNRKAGLERFEGGWQSPEAISRIKAERVEAVRRNFLDKELAFKITEEAVTQKTVSIVLGFLAVSALFLAATLWGGLKGLWQKPGFATYLAILVGGGGLAAYGLAAWLMLQQPAEHMNSGPEAVSTGSSVPSKVPALDELIFSIHQPPGSNAAEAPAQVLIPDLALNAFLKNYVKLEASGVAGGLSVMRKGLMVRVLQDRIVIFDEMSWVGQGLVVCYTIYFSESGGGIQFGDTEASVGNLPLPGRVFVHFWNQVEPLMGDVLTRSRVLQNYYIKRMETGTVEMVSNRAAPKQAALISP